MKLIYILLFVCVAGVFGFTDVFAALTQSPEAKDVAVSFADRMKFFGILVPAALGDSINPCAFAVMIILLSAILKEQKSRTTVLFSGFLFILAIFISYVAMGFGLYKALATTNSIFYLKLVVGILGIIIGLANLKDYFWYGKYFRMEVPTSWRPNMRKVLKKVVSPIGAFFVGFLISLFLLPCTSGPYIVVLGYLAAESSTINMWGYIYILIYNLIFIIPMVVICILIGFGIMRGEEVAEYKELNVERIHLITGIIMLLLGIYILFDILV